MPEKKLKIVYVYSLLTSEDPAHCHFLTSMQNQGLEVVVVALNAIAGSAFEKYLQKAHIDCRHINYRSKRDWPLALVKMTKMLWTERPDAVHAHLLDANIVTLPAAWLARVRTRIYTRHHSDQNHVLFPHAVLYDKIANFFATDIIAISENVRNVLLQMDQAPPEKIRLVNHGFPMARFHPVDPERVTRMRKQIGAEGKGPIIGMFSRYIVWKGVQYVLPAFQEILKEFPNAYLVCSNAYPSKFRNKELEPLFQKLPKGSFVEIENITEVEVLYKVFDVFIHCPIDPVAEAFGMVYVEALAAEIPSVFTLSGIASEFAKHRKNCWVVDFKNPAAIAEGVISILRDKNLAPALREQGRKDVTERFYFEKMLHGLLRIYRLRFAEPKSGVLRRLAKKVLEGFLQQHLLLRAKDQTIVAYHDVSDRDSLAHSSDYSTSPEQFQKQMEFFQEHFEIVSLKEMPKKTTKPAMAITFDDGFFSIKNNVHPLLKKMGIPYTVFLNRCAVENNYLAYDTEYEHLNMQWVEKIYMDAEDIAELLRDGVSFGNHTQNHPILSKLSAATQEQEIMGNQNFLENKLGVKRRTFAIPYGKGRHYNDDTMAILERSGFEQILSTEMSTFLAGPRKLFPRVSILEESPTDLTYLLNRAMFKGRWGI